MATKKTKPPLKPEANEIATSGDRDITSSFIGNTLINPDTTLSTEGAGLGLQIYENLERDDKVYSALQTRKNAVSGREWSVDAASDDVRDIEMSEFVMSVLGSLRLGDIVKGLLDSRLKGFAVAEIIWASRSDGKIGIENIIGRDQRRFVFDLDRNLRMLTNDHLLDGEEVPPRKFLVSSFGSKVGNPYGSGLGVRLYWPVWFKKHGVRFWAIFLEKFGSPTVVGKYPASSRDKGEQTKLLNAAKAIQQESALIMPDNMEMELMEAKRGGATDSYQKYMEYWDKAISIAVLGQSLTTDVGSSGSRALGQVHNEVRLDLVKDDAGDISELFNCTLIPWLVDWNYADVKAYPKFKIRVEAEKDLKQLAERDSILIEKIGLPVDKQYFYDTYDIPKPENDLGLVLSPQPTPPPASPFMKFERERGGNEDTLSSFVDQAMAKGDMESIIGPVAKLVNEAKSLKDLRAMILTEFKDMNPVEIGNMLEQAIATANLLGRFEAIEN